MKFYYNVPTILLGVGAIALVQTQVILALSPQQVRVIANERTVRIDNSLRKEPIGSGVIIKQVGTTYFVLTAHHVIEFASDYEVVTFDGQRHPIAYRQIIQLPRIDLAILRFDSSVNYEKADLGNSEQLNLPINVFVSGYPGVEVTGGIRGKYQFTPGTISSISEESGIPFLIYSNSVAEGMSGSPVFDENGKVIGIHKGASGKQNSQSNATSISGFNGGIRINKFIELAPQTCIVHGKQELQEKNYQAAIASFTLGIEGFRTGTQTNDKSVDAYISRGYAYFLNQEYDKAIADATNALKLNQQLPLAYLLQGASRAQKGEHGRAILDFDQAIKLNPRLAEAYGLRAVSRAQTKNITGANEDDRQANNLSRQTDSYVVSLYERKPSLNLPPATSQITPSPTPTQTPIPTPSTNVAVALPTNWSLLNTLNAGARVVTIAISPNQQILASGTGEGRIYLWNLNTRTKIHTLQGDAKVLRAIAFSKDGSKLASGGSEGVKIWDIPKGTLIKNIPLPSSVESLAFSPDGQTLAIGMGNGTITIWQANTWRSLKSFPAHSDSVSALVYSPDGTMIASGGGGKKDKLIRLWSSRQAEYGNLLHTFTGHEHWIFSLAFAPDGQTLISSSIDRTIKVWNSRTRRLLLSIPVGIGIDVREVAISPDGKLLASGNNSLIRLWSLPDGKYLGDLPGRESFVLSLAFASNNQLISGSEDGTIKIWQRR